MLVYNIYIYIIKNNVSIVRWGRGGECLPHHPYPYPLLPHVLAPLGAGPHDVN